MKRLFLLCLLLSGCGFVGERNIEFNFQAPGFSVGWKSIVKGEYDSTNPNTNPTF